MPSALRSASTTLASSRAMSARITSRSGRRAAPARWITLQTASESSSTSRACSACSAGRRCGRGSRRRAYPARARAGRAPRPPRDAGRRRRPRAARAASRPRFRRRAISLADAEPPGSRARAKCRGSRRAGEPVPSDPTPTFPEHMFPSLTTRRDRPRPLRELVRGALGTALEFATLGEATLGSARPDAPAPPPRVAGPRGPPPPPPRTRTAGGSLVSSARAGPAWSAARTQACRSRFIARHTDGPEARGARSGRTGAPPARRSIPGAPDFIASRAARTRAARVHRPVAPPAARAARVHRGRAARREPTPAGPRAGPTVAATAATSRPARGSRPPTQTSRPAGGSSRKNRRRPTLPGPCEPSTIGAVGLNCSVRNGKRCFPHAIATGNCSRPAPPRSLKTAQHANQAGIKSVKPSTH